MKKNETNNEVQVMCSANINGTGTNQIVTVGSMQSTALDDFINQGCKEKINVKFARMDYGEEVVVDAYEDVFIKLIEEASAQGVFNQGQEFLPVVCEKQNFNICAGIRNSHQNKKSICMQFDYKNGEYSDLFEFPQSDLVKWARVINSTLQAKEKNLPVPLAPRSSKRDTTLDKFDNLLMSQIHPSKIKFLTTADSKGILMEIYNNYESLPIIEKTPDIKEAYVQILTYICKHKNNFHKLPECIGKSTYRILPEYFEEMAEELGYKKKELVDLLKKHNMLYLTPSSTPGGLTKVRIYGDTVNCYCIKKLAIIKDTPNSIQMTHPKHNTIIETDADREKQAKEAWDMLKNLS